MDEKKLQVFLTIVRSGSISKAAEHLDYTQPALTQMMNSLDEELGCRLLERTYKGAVLTEEGAHLLPYAEAALEAIEQLRHEAAHTASAKKQVLRIGTYPSITQSWLSAIIRQFQQAHPEITIQLQVGGYDLASQLEEGALDLAFLAEAAHGGCTWIPLMEDPFFAVLQKSNPLAAAEAVTIDQLLAYPLIPTECHEIQAWLGQHNVVGGMHITATDDASRLSLVEQGLGVAVLPGTSLTNHSDKVRTVPLTPPVSRTLGAVYIGRATKETALFIRFIQKKSRVE